MTLALAEAEAAAARGEVPVGAVLLGPDGAVLAQDGNRIEAMSDPTAHAELLVLRRAAESLGRPRLVGCDLYVTLEPCPMCAGAIVQARLPYVVYGAADPKAGACASLYQITSDPRLNHRARVIGGVLAERCGGVLGDFFAARRRAGKG